MCPLLNSASFWLTHIFIFYGTGNLFSSKTCLFPKVWCYFAKSNYLFRANCACNKDRVLKLDFFHLQINMILLESFPVDWDKEILILHIQNLHKIYKNMDPNGKCADHSHSIHVLMYSPKHDRNMCQIMFSMQYINTEVCKHQDNDATMTFAQYTK